MKTCLFLGTSPGEPLVRDLLDSRRIGLMCQPSSNHPQPGWLWAADNGCGPGADGVVPEFTSKKAERWCDWLWERPSRAGCLFAAVPDVVGDAAETLVRFHRYRSIVADAGYPVAFVGQDGLDLDRVPWPQIDAFFVGGSTAWKASEAAFGAAAEARRRGKWVHVGRVNGDGRFQAWRAHADSADGTILAFGPATNVPRVVAWLEKADREPSLFGGHHEA